MCYLLLPLTISGSYFEGQKDKADLPKVTELINDNQKSNTGQQIPRPAATAHLTQQRFAKIIKYWARENGH